MTRVAIVLSGALLCLAPASSGPAQSDRARGEAQGGIDRKSVV